MTPAAPRYAELHCRSNFSFLTGASHPGELVARAAQLGYAALAITDECSLSGVVRAHEATKEQRAAGHALQLVIGSEFRLSGCGSVPACRLVLLAMSLAAKGVVTSAGLWHCEPLRKVLVAGVVTHRQRPMTAQGTTFMNLEDETGLINVVVSKGCWARYRKVARGAAALLVRGRLERAEGVINIVAEELTPLPVAASAGSRDFR